MDHRHLWFSQILIRSLLSLSECSTGLCRHIAGFCKELQISSLLSTAATDRVYPEPFIYLQGIEREKAIDLPANGPRSD